MSGGGQHRRSTTARWWYSGLRGQSASDRAGELRLERDHVFDARCALRIPHCCTSRPRARARSREQIEEHSHSMPDTLAPPVMVNVTHHWWSTSALVPTTSSSGKKIHRYMPPEARPLEAEGAGGRAPVKLTPGPAAHRHRRHVPVPHGTALRMTPRAAC